MTIEIHQPQLQALIQERMASGRFESIEAVLLQALQSSRGDDSLDLEDASEERLIAAMQASPYKEVDIEPARPHMAVRDVTL